MPADPLFSDFRGAMNAELASLGCLLHVADRDPGRRDEFLLLAADGSELGWLPDHCDAHSIAAFERVLGDVNSRSARPPSPCGQVGTAVSPD